MRDRAEVLEAALDMLPEGVCLVGNNCQVLFWNQAAQAMTGYTAIELVGRPYPEELRALVEPTDPGGDAGQAAQHHAAHGTMCYIRHEQGHDVATLTRHLVLRDGLGHRMRTEILFHPAENLDGLPHGEGGESEKVEASQDELTDRLESAFAEFAEGEVPLGVLWISVDQAHELRKTHGADACEAMLHTVERVLINGLKPTEHLGRWGDDEFLVISHECGRTALAEHAQALAGMTRTADFRWWGDRVSLTVSIGAAQAEGWATLNDLLERAKSAMHWSAHAGGNHVTTAAEAQQCSRS
jgi:diguanylate cyclase (GGDEF)-like protein